MSLSWQRWEKILGAVHMQAAAPTELKSLVRDPGNCKRTTPISDCVWGLGLKISSKFFQSQRQASEKFTSTHVFCQMINNQIKLTRADSPTAWNVCSFKSTINISLFVSTAKKLGGESHHLRNKSACSQMIGQKCETQISDQLRENSESSKKKNKCPNVNLTAWFGVRFPFWPNSFSNFTDTHIILCEYISESGSCSLFPMLSFIILFLRLGTFRR